MRNMLAVHSKYTRMTSSEQHGQESHVLHHIVNNDPALHSNGSNEQNDGRLADGKDNIEPDDQQKEELNKVGEQFLKNYGILLFAILWCDRQLQFIMTAFTSSNIPPEKKAFIVFNGNGTILSPIFEFVRKERIFQNSLESVYTD